MSKETGTSQPASLQTNLAEQRLETFRFKDFLKTCGPAWSAVVNGVLAVPVMCY